MDCRMSNRGRFCAALLGLCLAAALASSAQAQGYPQYDPNSRDWEGWAGCKNIPKYPGFKVIADPRSGVGYLIQAVLPDNAATEEKIRAWFAQNLHGWSFYATPSNQYPVYSEFRDPRSGHFVRIERRQRPIGIRYKCF